MIIGLPASSYILGTNGASRATELRDKKIGEPGLLRSRGRLLLALASLPSLDHILKQCHRTLALGREETTTALDAPKLPRRKGARSR